MDQYHEYHDDEAIGEGRIVRWAYALTRQSTDDETQYAIRELYFDAAGNVVTWTVGPAHPTGDTVGELQADLQAMDSASMSPRVFDIDAGEFVDVDPEH